MGKNIITIDLSKIDNECDYDFLSLLSTAAFVAKMEGVLTEKQASWLEKKAKSLTKCCKDN